MALRLAMRRATAGGSNILNRLINRGGGGSPVPTPFISSIFATRFNHTVGLYTHPKDEEFRRVIDEFNVNRGSADTNMRNPFQVNGPRGWYEIKEVDEGLFMRIEMPGIAEEDVKVSAEYGNLQISGQGRKEWPGSIGRGYNAQVEFPTDLFEEKNMEHVLKNGVLRIFIPRNGQQRRLVGNDKLNFRSSLKKALGKAWNEEEWRS